VEIIVVEDGSDSGAEAWLQGKALNHVRYVRHAENRGLAVARNTGLCLARGKYVAYLDDDDEWEPDKLATQVDLFETRSEDLAVVHSGAVSVDAHGNPIQRHAPVLKGSIRAEIGRRGWSAIPLNTGLFLREPLQQLGGHDVDLSSHTEYGIWMKMAQADYRADYVDEYSLRAREHPDNRMTTDIETRLQATERFIEKWQPELNRWFGLSKARAYCSQLYASVFVMLAVDDKGRVRVSTGIRSYLFAMRRNPDPIGTYVRSMPYFAGCLFAQTPFSGALRHLWRKTLRKS
jgi:glycosyltransferase involved in cell wall biosynthesis